MTPSDGKDESFRREREREKKGRNLIQAESIPTS